MSTSAPPEPNVNLFNNAYWQTSDEFVTIDYANKHYLKYPIAQGKETLQAVDVNGVATFKNNLFIQDASGNNSSFSQSGTNLIIDNNADDSNIIFRTDNSSGTERTQFTISPKTGIVLAQNRADNVGSNPILKAIDLQGGRSINFWPASYGGNYNPIVVDQDDILYAQSTVGSGLETLTLTTHSSTNCGIRIRPTQIIMGAGGTTSTPSTSITCNGTNVIVAGFAQFTSTTAPTSSQTLPLASDNSTKIPTTAWVQTAIAASGNPTNLTPNRITLTPTTTTGSNCGIINQYNTGGMVSFSGNSAAYYPYLGNTSNLGRICAQSPVTFGFRNRSTVPTGCKVLKYKVTMTFWSWDSSGSQGSGTFGQTSFNIDFYPDRWTQGTPSDPTHSPPLAWPYVDDAYNANNRIGFLTTCGNYAMKDTVYAPDGRQYWTYNQQFSGGASGYNALFYPGRYGGGVNTDICFQLFFVLPATSGYEWSYCIECLDASSANAVGFGVYID